MRCITMMSVASCIPFPFAASCDDMLTMLVCATHWLSMHPYTLAYMFMHESCLLVCCPCFNITKLWKFDPNLHLSLADATFCLLSYLFVCYLLCLFASILVAMLAIFIFLVLFASSCYYLCIVFPLLVCWFSCLCLCMHIHGARTHKARARSLKRKQKGHGRKHVVEPSGCS